MDNLSKSHLGNFFRDPENKALLDVNDFDELYRKYIAYTNRPSDLTQLLLDSKIDFMNYMETLPAWSFYTVKFDYTLVIPKNIHFIKTSCFSDSYIPSILLQGVLQINDAAFYDCEFESISVPAGFIGERIFAKCSKLKNVAFTSSIIYQFKSGIFMDCPNIQSVSFAMKFSSFYKMLLNTTTLKWPPEDADDDLKLRCIKLYLFQYQPVFNLDDDTYDDVQLNFR